MSHTIHDLLAAYRATSQTEREKGTYFEELIRTYFRYEPSYADLYSDVWLFADWAKALENSQIVWSKYQPTAAPALKPKKELLKHQTSAKTKALLSVRSADRGKLIMACGTGQTFTSLKIAEDVAGPGKITLFLVPSLNQ